MNLGAPLTGSWMSFNHPEWSPDGTSIVVTSETSTEWNISTINATGFGW